MKIRPRNWGDFQHYKDRSPPWIRLHRCLLDDFDFQRLPVASRALAPMLWLLAAESKDPKTGEIDASADRLAFRLRMTEREVVEALKPLITGRFFEVVQDASDALADSYQVAVPEAEAETEGETEKALVPADAATPPKVDKSERLAAVTRDAVAAYNESLAKPRGLLSVVTLPDSETRRANVKRCLRVAALICQDQFGDSKVTPEFWSAYFASVRADPFLSGAGPYSGSHANWRPDFEYLTRPETVEKVFDRAVSA